MDKDGSKEQPNVVLDQLIHVTRPTGGLGIPGLYVPADPGAPDAQSGKGQILISFGKLFEKGLHLGTGQCNVKVRDRSMHARIVRALILLSLSAVIQPSAPRPSVTRPRRLLRPQLTPSLSDHVWCGEAVVCRRRGTRCGLVTRTLVFNARRNVREWVDRKGRVW